MQADLLPAEPPGKPKNSRQPIPSPGDLPNLETDPGSPALQADSLPTELSGKPNKKEQSMILMDAVTWVNLENMVLSESSQMHVI